MLRFEKITTQSYALHLDLCVKHRDTVLLHFFPNMPQIGNCVGYILTRRQTFAPQNTQRKECNALQDGTLSQITACV